MTGRTLENRRRRLWLMAGLAVGALGLSAPMSASAQTAHHIHIVAGSLDAALQALAAQSHDQLLYASTLVAGRRAPAVDGDLTTEQALQRLLGGDPAIAFRRTGPAVFVVRAAQGATSPFWTAPADRQTIGGADRPFDAERATPSQAGAPAELQARSGPPVGVTVAEVEVTGTHIRGAQIASPINVLSREDLDRSGRTTVAEALKALPQNFGGAAADGTGTTGADRVGRNGAFGTGLNLRGLGNNATLVLVNGRRVGGSGSFGDFTDVSTIPSSAVERVDVLLDGASAIYGSDAVGGVVNIILRKSYDGAETQLLAGAATRGDGEPREGRLSQTLGRRWGSGGVLVTLEAEQRDALNGGARRFAGNADLRALGGSDDRVTFSFPGNIVLLNPATGVNVPAFAIPSGQDGVGLTAARLLPGVVNLFNQRTGADVLPRQTTESVYIAFDQAFGDRFELSGDARYGIRRYHVQSSYPISQLTVTAANPFFVSPIGATSETIAYAFADLPFPTQSGHVETISSTLGGSLKLDGDWRVEGYLAFGQEIDLGRSAGNLNSAHLNEALGVVPDQAATTFSTAANGFYNPFAGVPGANSPAVLAFIGNGSTYIRSTDRVYSANLQVDGSLWTLPAGRIRLAAGLNARQETFVRGGFNFVGAAPTAAGAADTSRNVTAAYAEIQAPVFGPGNRRPGFERLDLSLAARVEHYEAIGTTANPKLGLVWEPTSGLRVRTTVGSSFRAPSLRETGDPAVFIPTLLGQGATRVQVLELTGGNPSLKPETALSWTAGVDYDSPQWPGLRVGLTWFDIRYRNRIDKPVQANLQGALTDPALTTFVTRISPLTNAADLARISALLSSPAVSTVGGVFPPTAFGAIVDARYVNDSRLEVRGLDANAAYEFDLGRDTVAVTTNASYMVDYEQRVTPTTPARNKVGVVGFPTRFRSRSAIDWKRGLLAVGAALNYTGAYKDLTGRRIDADPTVDVQVRFGPVARGLLKGVTASFNVRNLFDRDPPFYNNPVGIGYDPNNGDPIGRFAFVQLTRAW